MTRSRPATTIERPSRGVDRLQNVTTAAPASRKKLVNSNVVCSPTAGSRSSPASAAPTMAPAVLTA